MVWVALPVPIVAPLALLSTTLKVSLSSTVLSAFTFSVMVLLVSPAAKLTVPLVLPLRSSALAVPGWKAQLTLALLPVEPLRLTVKLTGVLPPLLPSLTDDATALMLRLGMSSLRMV